MLAGGAQPPTHIPGSTLGLLYGSTCMQHRAVRGGRHTRHTHDTPAVLLHPGTHPAAATPLPVLAWCGMVTRFWCAAFVPYCQRTPEQIRTAGFGQQLAPTRNKKVRERQQNCKVFRYFLTTPPPGRVPCSFSTHNSSLCAPSAQSTVALWLLFSSAVGPPQQPSPLRCTTAATMAAPAASELPKLYQGVQKQSFGYKMLATLGWKEGQGLVSLLKLQTGPTGPTGRTPAEVCSEVCLTKTLSCCRVPTTKASRST